MIFREILMSFFFMEQTLNVIEIEIEKDMWEWKKFKFLMKEKFCAKKKLENFNKIEKFLQQKKSKFIDMISVKMMNQINFAKIERKTKQIFIFEFFFCMNKSQVVIQSTSLEVKIKRKNVHMDHTTILPCSFYYVLLILNYVQ